MKQASTAQVSIEVGECTFAGLPYSHYSLTATISTPPSTQISRQSPPVSSPSLRVGSTSAPASSYTLTQQPRAALGSADLLLTPKLKEAAR